MGEAAHICGEHPGAARYDPGMSDSERNSYHNLIFLCPNHHNTIDKLESDFPVVALQAMKSKHEECVHDAILERMESVGFKELEIATAAFVRASVAPAG